MYKYIFIGLILSALTWNVEAQDRKALANEITAKMSFLKKGYEKRQIEFRDDSIYGNPFLKIISKKNIAKDSLRHLLVDNGFYDYNFELFELKIKNLNEFDEAFIKHNNPQLVKLLSDSTFNKVTYSFQESADGINVSLVLSENDIVVDSEIDLHFSVDPGYYTYKATYKGYSRKMGITHFEDTSFLNLIQNEKNQQRAINLDENNRFKITVDLTNSRKYIGIRDSAGKMISVIKP